MTSTKKQEEKNYRYISILFLIKTGFGIFDISKILGIHKNTVINYIKNNNINVPYSFHQTSKKFGRRPGFKMSQEQKDLRSKLFKGKGNPFYDKKHSEKTKAKMSKNHADFSGDKNPFRNKFYSDELFRNKFIETHKKLWKNRDDKWRKSFGEKISRSLANSDKFNNINFHKYHICGHYYHKKCGIIFYRSSWELFAAEILSSLSFVKTFSLEAFCIDYIDENNTTKYTRIDFFINLNNGIKILMEVKPRGLQNFGNNPYKIKAYKYFCDENNIVFILFDEGYMHNDKLINELKEIINKYDR